jgi:hypothetical protein
MLMTVFCGIFLASTATVAQTVKLERAAIARGKDISDLVASPHPT